MMRTSKLLFLLVVLIPFITFSQGESNNWCFGFGAGLHFPNDGTVEAIYGCQTEASEGVSSISNPDGQLLFYTDGGTVYNRNHDVMINGDNLFGTEGSTQSSLIVPVPQSSVRYYIFTVDATSIDGVRGRGLNYSIVDISLDNGNGAVVEKNTNLLRDCTEKLAAIIGDCRGEIVWIVTLATPTGDWYPTPPFPVFNTYHAFRLDANGVSPNSVVSTFPMMTQFDQGYLKFSPDGTKLANAHMRNGLFLSDFDTSTGTVSNQQSINVTGTATISYGVEFSPNSQFLYVNAFQKRPGIFEYDSSLLQYDVLATDISGSQVIIESNEYFRGALQLANNGKIYRTLTTSFSNGYVDGTPIENGRSYLGAINNPNEKGIACDYEPNAIEIPGNRVRQGLPPMVQRSFTEISLIGINHFVIDENLAACLGEPLVFEIQNIPGATYIWEKDNNPLPSAQTNLLEIASVSIADVGNYSVTIIRPNALECPINGDINVMVYEKPVADNLSITVCDIGDDDTSDGKTKIDLPQVFVDEDLNYTFYSSSSNLMSDTPIIDSQAYVNTTPFEEVLYYKVINTAGCENSGELTLIVRDVPDLIIEDNYLLCTDQADLVITGPDGFDTYTWFRVEDGGQEIASTDKNLNVIVAGNYKLEVSIVNITNGVETSCLKMAEFQVLSSNTAIISEVKVDRFTDNDTIVEITVTGNGNYEFSSDGITYQDAHILENVNAGIVTLSVRDKNGCGVVTETVEIIPDKSSGFPNFFTPNNDSINDVWHVLPAPEGEELDIVEISIYTRYGDLLIQIYPDSNGWDGNSNGKSMPSSDYWFRATKGNGQSIKGHFTLKR